MKEITMSKINHEGPYGVINEDTTYLRFPRPVDEEYNTFGTALEKAAQMVADGHAETVSVVRARWSTQQNCYVELGEGGSVHIDATMWERQEEE